jgi:catechol 2,3-dioxygenase-like lactoylglutathione lyase family enzyme
MAPLNKVVTFVATTNPQNAKRFYEEKLGLRFVSDDGFALVFDIDGIMLRIAKVPDFRPAPFTILGWEVSDIEDSVSHLNTKGVEFERFPGIPQDELGIWNAPGGARVAWFKDPDGNILSLSQHPA